MIPVVFAFVFFVYWCGKVDCITCQTVQFGDCAIIPAKQNESGLSTFVSPRAVRNS